VKKINNINKFSSMWYFRDKLSIGSVENVETTFDPWLSNNENFSTVDAWKCNAQSSYTGQQGPGPWSVFLNSLMPVIDNFSSSLGCTANYMQCTQVWANKYGPGGFQEYHSHSDRTHQISFCYFYKPVRSVSLFRFIDREYDMCILSGLSEVLPNVPGIEQDVRVENVEKGDIILFPSYYPHIVDPNPTEEERITFSGNIEIKNI